MHFTSLVVLTVALFIVNVASAMRECAPEADVKAALASAERRAAESLGETEASELVEELKRSGVKQEDGTICFTDADFARFGSLVSAFFREHESTGTVRQQEFDFDEQSQLQSAPRGGNSCVCRTCPRDHNSYCANSGSAICCPQYCANIFSAVSLAALAGVEGSGLDTCCQDGMKICPRPQAQRRAGAPPRRAKTGSAPPPELDFGDEDDSDVVFQTNSNPLGGFADGFMSGFRGRRTITPAPSLSPSPSARFEDAHDGPEVPHESPSPSATPLLSIVPSVAPSPDPTTAPSPMSDDRTPVEVEVMTAAPSPTGPSLPPIQDEFESTEAETLLGQDEEQSDLASVGSEDDIQESPEDEVREI